MKKIILGLVMIFAVGVVVVSCKKQSATVATTETQIPKALGTTAKKIHQFTLQQKSLPSQHQSKICWNCLVSTAAFDMQGACGAYFSFGMYAGQVGMIISLGVGAISSMTAYPHIHPVVDVNAVTVPINSSNPYERIGIEHNDILLKFYSKYAGAETTDETKTNMANDVVDEVMVWKSNNYSNASITNQQLFDDLYSAPSVYFPSSIEDAATKFNDYLLLNYTEGKISSDAYSILNDYFCMMQYSSTDLDNLATNCDTIINDVNSSTDLSSGEKEMLLSTLTIGKYSAYFHVTNFQ